MMRRSADPAPQPVITSTDTAVPKTMAAVLAGAALGGRLGCGQEAAQTGRGFLRLEVSGFGLEAGKVGRLRGSSVR
jgi:hypothetical protein